MPSLGHTFGFASEERIAEERKKQREKQRERCPSCFGTDEQFKRGFYKCTDPWHADDHLRKPR